MSGGTNGSGGNGGAGGNYDAGGNNGENSEKISIHVRNDALPPKPASDQSHNRKVVIITKVITIIGL